MTHNTKEVVTKFILKKNSNKKEQHYEPNPYIELLCRQPQEQRSSNWDLEIPKLNHPAFQY